MSLPLLKDRMNARLVQTAGHAFSPLGSALLAFCGYQPYQVVSACIMNHPALLHHRGAPPLGVFDRLDHPHQRDVGASGRARRTDTYIHTLTIKF